MKPEVYKATKDGTVTYSIKWRNEYYECERATSTRFRIKGHPKFTGSIRFLAKLIQQGIIHAE